MKCPEKANPWRQSRLVAARGWGRENMKWLWLFPSGGMKMFLNQIVVMVAQYFECTKCH